jgi:hypothetical protein
MNGNFDLLSSSSNEPSSTISINPTVPSIGNIDVKSGTNIWKVLAPYLTAQPTISNNITDGIFVFNELILKTWASSSKRHIVMIIEVVIFWFIFKFVEVFVGCKQHSNKRNPCVYLPIICAHSDKHQLSE